MPGRHTDHPLRSGAGSQDPAFGARPTGTSVNIGGTSRTAWGVRRKPSWGLKMELDREALVQEYEAAIDVMEQALQDCPEALWERSVWTVKKSDPWIWPKPGVEPVAERTEEAIQRFSAFWVVAYHCLWFLDYYVTNDAESFQSPEAVRGGPEEQGFAADGAVAVPVGRFAREVLLDYASHGRRKMKDGILSASEADLERPRAIDHPHAGKSYGQLVVDNLEHVREHAEQLNRFVAENSVPKS